MLATSETGFPLTTSIPFRLAWCSLRFPFWPAAVDPWSALLVLGGALLAGGAMAFWIYRHDPQSAVAMVGMLALVLFSLAHLLTLYALAVVVLLFRFRAHQVGRYARAVRLALAVTLPLPSVG